MISLPLKKFLSRRPNKLYISKFGVVTALTGGVLVLSLLAGWIPGGYSDVQNNWAYCSKLCNSDKDCNSSSSSCNVCAYSGKEKMCTSPWQNQSTIGCGGPAFPPPPRHPSLPQYLVIGDPIMQAMFPYLKNMLQGIVDAYLIPGKPKKISDALKCIGKWIGTDRNRWDIVSLSFGTWDAAGKGSVDLNATYAVNVNDVTGYILNHTKPDGKTKVIFVLATPTPNTTACCPNKFNLAKGITPCPSTIQLYNTAARNALRQFGSRVVIDDLWSWVNLKCCYQETCTYDLCNIRPNINPRNCPVNFSGPGYKYLAQNVSGTVKSILK